MNILRKEKEWELRGEKPEKGIAFILAILQCNPLKVRLGNWHSLYKNDSYPLLVYILYVL